jgi:hypothetical protein
VNLVQQQARLWLIGLAMAMGSCANARWVPSAWAKAPMEKGVLLAPLTTDQSRTMQSRTMQSRTVQSRTVQSRTMPGRSLPTADRRLAQGEPDAGNEEAVITSETFSATGLTLPSLWWVKDQLSQKKPLAAKLLQKWRAYPGNPQQPGRIELLVNRQFWSLLDYVERYTFLNEFGEAAREYRYNIQVLDGDALTNAPLASYMCDFSALPPPTTDTAIANPTPSPPDRSVVIPNLDVKIPNLPCQISLDSSGKAGFRGGSTPASSGTKGLRTDAP